MSNKIFMSPKPSLAFRKSLKEKVMTANHSATPSSWSTYWFLPLVVSLSLILFVACAPLIPSATDLTIMADIGSLESSLNY